MKLVQYSYRKFNINYWISPNINEEDNTNIVLFSQKELVDSVKIHELLGSSDHNQIHFDIKIK